MKAAAQLRPGWTSSIVIIFLATLSACAPLVEVRETKPKPGASHGTAAERAIVKGAEVQRREPTKAVGYYVEAVRLAGSDLRKNDQVAIHDYNFALSRILSLVRESSLDPWNQPLRITTPTGGQDVLTYRPPAEKFWKPQEFELVPADELQRRGRLINRRVTREGAGAPLVVISKPGAAALRDPFVAPHIYAAVTAVAHFNGRRCDLEFVDPLAVQEISVGGRSLPCAADFTAPVALGLAREHPERSAFSATLDPEKFAIQTRLVRVQPYDPKKIPVLFVHGLQSTPVTWVPMVNALGADPVIRGNYQAWVFHYPSGYPVPYAAMLLRRQLEAVDKAFPDHRGIILVGHSMGGLLGRLMITDSHGDKVWRYYFGNSPAQTALSPNIKALLEEALIFRPHRHIARAIFISTPHRGSVIAQGGIGRLASSMVRRSARAAAIFAEASHASVIERNDPEVLKLRRMPDSIDTLSPNDAWVKIMNTLPMEQGVPYHSIIGDRGRGDTPNSSDGIVPYWSSHLDGAASEKIVPSNHSANENAQAIAEVVRILREHIASKRSGRQPRTGLSTIQSRSDSKCASVIRSSSNLRVNY